MMRLVSVRCREGDATMPKTAIIIAQKRKPGSSGSGTLVFLYNVEEVYYLAVAGYKLYNFTSELSHIVCCAGPMHRDDRQI